MKRRRAQLKWKKVLSVGPFISRQGYKKCSGLVTWLPSPLIVWVRSLLVAVDAAGAVRVQPVISSKPRELSLSKTAPTRDCYRVS